MKQDAQKIANEIRKLLDQLVTMSAGPKYGGRRLQKKELPATKKGAAGALSMLITEEGFFDKPRNISSIMSKLKEMGRYYPQSTVAMNLLNLTRRRVLSRFPDKKTKDWQYVVRK